MSMLLRRQMMRKTAADDYITDGLDLWLDGLEKGNTADAWTDKVGGHVFAGHNGVTFGTNCVELAAGLSQYLDNSTYDGTSTDNGTIEVAVSGMVSNTIIFFPKSAAKCAFGLSDSAGGIIWRSSGGGSARYVFSASAGFKVASVTESVAYVDGTSARSLPANAYSGPNGTNYIGRRPTGTMYYIGKIYAIRIYNRQLTAAEMLHNQRIDNARFNLGLTI